MASSLVRGLQPSVGRACSGECVRETGSQPGVCW